MQCYRCSKICGCFIAMAQDQVWWRGGFMFVVEALDELLVVVKKGGRDDLAEEGELGLPGNPSSLG